MHDYGPITHLLASSFRSLQIAKSSRAKCKTSKEPIQKGELKIVVEAPLREGADFAFSSSHKVSCFKIPRKLVSQGVTIEDFVEDYLMDDGTILIERKNEILAMLREAAAKKKTKAKVNSKSDGSESIMDRLKMAAAESEGDEPPKKKAKGSTELEDFISMLKVYKKYHKDKVAELKDILRWNKQIIGGTKEFILFKVVDGVVHGRLWLCPLCSGDLKYKDGDFDNIVCSGRYDEGTFKFTVFQAQL